jgi:hypothetical protein
MVAFDTKLPQLLESSNQNYPLARSARLYDPANVTTGVTAVKKLQNCHCIRAAIFVDRCSVIFAMY